MADNENQFLQPGRCGACEPSCVVNSAAVHSQLCIFVWDSRNHSEYQPQTTQEMVYCRNEDTVVWTTGTWFVTVVFMLLELIVVQSQLLPPISALSAV